MSKPRQTNQIYMVDATLPEAKNTVQGVITFGKTFCDKWVFQLEEGKQQDEQGQGYRHFQCRFKLKERLRLHQIIALMQSNGLIVHSRAVSPTSKACASKPVWSYVMKEDTRIDGPWSDRDVDMDRLPERLRLPLMSPYPWQRSCVELPRDCRRIHFIVDEQGHSGKTTFGQAWKEVHPDDVLYVKFNPRDMRALEEGIVAKYNAGEKYRDFVVYVNMPRGAAAALTESQAQDLMNVLEQVKDGHMVDRRYKYTETTLGNTLVIVVSNEAVPFTDKYLSEDRPQYWRIDRTMRLQEVRLWVPNPGNHQLDQQLYVLPDFNRRSLSRVPSAEDLEEGWEVRWQEARERTPPPSPTDQE